MEGHALAHALFLATAAAVHGDVDAVACAYCRTIARVETPFEQRLAAQSVRRAQRLDRRGKRHHRELRDEVEADEVGRPRIG